MSATRITLISIFKGLCRMLRWWLAEQRIQTRHPLLYKSLDIVEQVELTHSISPFVSAAGLDAFIYAFTGETEKLRACLDRGVRPNLQGLMEIAIRFHHFSVVKLLLDRGADPNRIVDSTNTTLLHEAVIAGDLVVVELLLSRGADPNFETRDGRRALDFAYDRTEGRTPLVKLLKPLTKTAPARYNVEETLKIKDPEKAYWALCATIQKAALHEPSPAELRVLSLADFTGNCLTNGFLTFDTNARWAIVPSAELMDAIDELVLARELWACIEICREYGRKLGRDPFDPDVDYVRLDEATEDKICTRKFDFTDYVDPQTDERLYRKTMEYVRKNRDLFPPAQKTL